MKYGSLFLTVMLSACLGAMSLWLSGCSSNIPVKDSEKDAEQKLAEKVEEELKTKDNNPLEIAKSGPQPKAVVDEKMFEFGEMEIGSEEKHTFIIRNEGKAPLRLTKRGKGTTCKCTLSELARDDIPPGESAEVELSWTPKETTPVFEQAAYLWSNDPKQEQIELRIKGKVVRTLELSPPNNWVVEKIKEDQPTELSGVLYSPLFDDFNILDVESSDDYLSAKIEKLPADKLKEFDAKSGYSIKATIAKGIPVGPYQGTLTVHTDAREGHHFEIIIEAERTGPIQILPMAGAKFYGKAMALDMGRFRVSEGKTNKLSVFIDGEMDVLKTESSLDFLKLKAERDENFKGKGRQRFVLTFEIPPGSPPTVSSKGNIALVKLITSHPDLKEIKFKVAFISN